MDRVFGFRVSSRIFLRDTRYMTKVSGLAHFPVAIPLDSSGQDCLLVDIGASIPCSIHGCFAAGIFDKRCRAQAAFELTKATSERSFGGLS